MTTDIQDSIEVLYVKGALSAFRLAWAADRRRNATKLHAGDGLPEDVKAAVKAAVTEAVDVDSIAGELGGEALKGFLGSVECSEILATLYVARSAENQSAGDLSDLFVAAATHWTGGDAVEPAALRSLFERLVENVNAVLAALVENSGQSALNALATYRHSILDSRLRTMEDLLTDYSGGTVPSPADIEAFLRDFRKLVADRDGIVQTPSFDRNTRHEVSEVYVSPRLRLAREKEFEGDGYQLDSVLTMDRVVILGDPGGGKSTLTQKLCADICRDRVSGEYEVTFRVLLRDAYSGLGESPPLIDHVIGLPNGRYQMPGDHGQSVLHALRSGIAVLIFDGLDEILDIGTRMKAVSDIEAIAHQFPATPIIVTSRRIGFELTPFRSDVFEEMHLGPFTNSDVSEYVSKWISAEGAELPRPLEEMVKDFMNQSEEVVDLRSNPLLLGLMCNLFRGENSIPSNRPEIYEKCAVMLFERWDARRSIYEPVSFSSQLRPTMQRLADWIYFDPTRSQGVLERDIREKAAAVLMERRFSNPDEAQRAADEFVDLCKGRAWVFTNTGTAENGEELFQFTHRTFLEYFTAEWLVGVNPTATGLAERIWPMIRDREGSVVSQLALQVLNRRSPASVDDCLVAIMDLAESEQGDTDDFEVYALAFCLESLKYVVPAPTLTRALETRFLDLIESEFVPSGPVSTVFLEAPEARKLMIGECAQSLFECGPEVVDELIGEFEEWVAQPGEGGKRVAIGYLMAIGEDRFERVSDAAVAWYESLRAVVEAHAAEIKSWADRDFEIAFQCVFEGKIDVTKFTQTWGVTGLVSDVGYTLSPGTGRISLIAHAIRSATGRLGGLQMSFQDSALQEFGALVADGAVIDLDSQASPVDRYLDPEETDVAVSSSSALFGFFAVHCLAYELDPDLFASIDLDLEPPDTTLKRIQWLVAGQGRYVDRRIALTDELFETDAQKEFARDWLCTGRQITPSMR